MTEPTPPCRLCGKTDHVGIYRRDAPEQTICTTCCGGDVEHHDGETGHQFEYERGEGHMCVYCGINRNDAGPDYAPQDDYD